MGIEVQSLREVDSSVSAAAETVLSSLITAYAPTLDTSGVLRQLVIRPQALLYAATRTEIDRMRRASSLRALAEDPALADADTVDRLMSNYMIARKQGTRATAVVTVTFSTKDPVRIPTTATFLGGGIAFRPVREYMATTAAGDGEGRLMFTADGAGGYWVHLQVIADDAGAVELDAGTSFDVSGVARVVSAVAASAVTGGSAAESNAQLLARALSTVAPRSIVTPEGVEQYMRDTLPSITAVSVHGYMSEGLVRNRHNMFSVAAPGMADVFVRTATEPSVTRVDARGFARVTREMLVPGAARTNIGVRVEITGYAHAGAYEVLGMYPATSSSDPSAVYAQSAYYTPHRHERNAAAAAGTVFTPTARDAAFSGVQGVLYATADIPVAALGSARSDRFVAWQSFWLNWYTYNDASASEVARQSAQASMATAAGGLGGGTVSTEFTAELDVWAWVYGMPGLAQLQAAITAPERRAPVDYLVRAFYPCEVGVSVKLLAYVDVATVDVDTVVAAIINAVRASGDTATKGIRVADIAHAVAQVAGTSYVVDMPVTLTARLRLPTDEVVTWQSTTSLVIPRTYAEHGVVPSTVAFYIRDADVSVEVEAAV